MWRDIVEDAVVIDAPNYENGVWEIQTQEDHILVFTAVDGNMKDAQDFIAVRLVYNNRWYLNSLTVGYFAGSRWSGQRFPNYPSRESKYSRTFKEGLANRHLYYAIDCFVAIQENVTFSFAAQNSESKSKPPEFYYPKDIHFKKLTVYEYRP